MASLYSLFCHSLFPRNVSSHSSLSLHQYITFIGPPKNFFFPSQTFNRAYLKTKLVIKKVSIPSSSPIDQDTKCFHVHLGQSCRMQIFIYFFLSSLLCVKLKTNVCLTLEKIHIKPTGGMESETMKSCVYWCNVASQRRLN